MRKIREYVNKLVNDLPEEYSRSNNIDLSDNSLRHR